MSTGDAGVGDGGLTNLRDLGGLRMVGGGWTQHGVLYRSDAPHRSDRTPASMSIWPPALVVDLRSDDEIREPHPWREVSDVLRLPLIDSAAVATEVAAGQVAGPDFLDRVYRDVLNSGADALAALIPHAAAVDGPVLIHCAAGKDRTGISAAVLLLAAGVRAEEVIADYVATGPNMAALIERRRRLGLRPADATSPSPAALAVPQHVIAMVVAHLTQGSDGIRGWARRHGVRSDDVMRWRAKLLRPAVE